MYFFKEKCKHFLTYISTTLYNEADYNILVGELYEFLSNDNWKILKMWEGKNGCSLNSYLASCSLRYFTKKIKEEKRRCEREIIPSTPEIIEYLNHFTIEEEDEEKPVWEAFYMLKERDQVILRQLVLLGKDMIHAAPFILPYIKSDKHTKDSSPKKIQGTIAMAKHRAVSALFDNLNTIIRN